MKSYTWQALVPLLEAKELSIDVNEVISFLSGYKSGSWIYPSALHRKLNISVSMIYEILDTAVSLDLVDVYFEVVCDSCNKYTGTYFKSIPKVIQNSLYCEHCDEIVENPLKNLYMIFKVK